MVNGRYPFSRSFINTRTFFSLESDAAKEWKDQVATLHAKLTQAGNHLKTLAQENARLNQQLAQHHSEREKHDDLLKTLGALSLDDDVPESLSAPEAKLIQSVKARMKQDKEKGTLVFLDDVTGRLTCV